MTDPIKAMVRHYDANVVANGGTSIFSVKAVGPFNRAAQDQRWRDETPHSDPSYYLWRQLPPKDQK